MRVIACRFGIGSVAALAVVVATGVALARRFRNSSASIRGGCAGGSAP
jgi:hypothetical protein